MYGASSHGSAPFGSKSSRGKGPRFFSYASVFYLAVSISGFVKNFSRELTAAMSLAGTWLKSIQHSVYAGALTFGTTIIKATSRTLSGVLALTSYVTRAVVYFLEGTVTLVVTFVPSRAMAFLTTLTLFGTNFRIAVRTLVATLTLSGANTKNRQVFHDAVLSVEAIFFRYKTILATGILGFGGAVSRVFNEKHFDVALNLSSDVSRMYERIWNATMTLAASITERSRDLQAMLTVQASYLRQFFMSADAFLTMTTQNVVKGVSKFFNSVFSLASPLRIDRIRFIQMSLTFALTLRKSVSRVITTSLTITATGFDHWLNKFFTGTLTVIGSAIDRARYLVGTFTFSATSFAKTIFRPMTTALTITGGGFKTVKRNMVALFTVTASAVTRSEQKFFAGTLSFLISIKKNVGKNVYATISLAASERRNIVRLFTVAFRTAATLIKSYNKNFVAALSIVVRYVRALSKLLTGELFVGTTFIRYPLRNSLALEWYSTYQAQSYNIYYSGTPHDQGILVDNTTSTYIALPISAIDYDLVAKQEKPTDYVSPFVKGVGWFAVYPVVDGLERECLIRKAVKV